jgi:hypothetical protein
MYNKIDESVRIEEVVHVNSPEVIQAKYKQVKNEHQRQWN